MEGKSSVSYSLAVALLLISTIGIGYAYSAEIQNESVFSSDYCSIAGYVNGSIVEHTSITSRSLDDSEIIFPLSFTSSMGTQETLSLHYHHTKGTDLILSISFVVSGLDERDQTIVCYEGADVIGSTLLSGIGEKSGTISGIVLGFQNKNIDDKIDYRFEIKGINSVEGISVQMSLSVHPLEVSS